MGQSLWCEIPHEKIWDHMSKSLPSGKSLPQLANIPWKNRDLKIWDPTSNFPLQVSRS